MNILARYGIRTHGPQMKSLMLYHAAELIGLLKKHFMENYLIAVHILIGLYSKINRKRLKNLLGKAIEFLKILIDEVLRTGFEPVT